MPWAATQANIGRAWLAGKLSPEGMAKQILFELSQFVLSRKLYVARLHRANHLISAQRNDGVFLLETYQAILILKRYPCESGFPAAKNRGKMPLTRYLKMNLAP